MRALVVECRSVIKEVSRMAGTNRVSVNVEGITLTAPYEIKSDVVTVFSALGSKSTQMGDNTAEYVARMLLQEIIKET